MQVHQQTPGQNTLKKRKNKGRKRTEEASPLRDHRAQKVMWLSGERRLLTRSSVLVGPTQWKERMRSCKLSWLSHACHSICAACTACACVCVGGYVRARVQLLPLALFAIEYFNIPTLNSNESDMSLSLTAWWCCLGSLYWHGSSVYWTSLCFS